MRGAQSDRSIDLQAASSEQQASVTESECALADAEKKCEEHMNAVNLQPRDAETRVPPVPMGRRYMVFGGPAPDISGLNLLNLEGIVGADCDGIILLKHINPLELTNALAESPDPAVPVADFFGNHPVRRDFIGSLLNDESAKEMGQRFASKKTRPAQHTCCS
jgi:hypothetical protein